MDIKTQKQLRAEAHGARMNISCALLFNLVSMIVAGIAMNTYDHHVLNLAFFATVYATLSTYVAAREGWTLAAEVDNATAEATSQSEESPAHVTGDSPG